VRLHYDVHEGRGPALLLVHGFLSSRAQWLDNLAGLSAFCRPVTVELWGHGRSPSPDDPHAYRVASYVEQFEQIRAELGLDRWFVCGQSFGAGLTLRYALTHPAALYGQVITNSISGLSLAAAPTDGEARAAAIEACGADGLRDLPYHPRFGRRTRPGLLTAMLEDAGRLSPTGVAHSIRYTGPELAVGEALAEVSVPTLLVNGVWEKAFQPVRNDALKRFPSLEVADLEGGHSINADAPEAFNAAVEAFVRRRA
jgi:2-succinyl-6-hydroxy-2,4-cyclohexadiene-1-carboxylate synthase